MAKLVTLYAGTTDTNTVPAETDTHPIASAEDHFHRSLVGGGEPKANNPHGTSYIDVGADILVEDTFAQYHANGIIGLAPGEIDAFTPGEGSLGWELGSLGVVRVNDLVIHDDGVKESLMIRGRPLTHGQITVLQTASMSALGLVADLYYIVIQWGSTDGGQPQIVAWKKSDFDALCVLSDGSHAWLNNAEDTIATDSSRGEKKFFVLGLVNWSGTAFSTLEGKSPITIPAPDGDLIYSKDFPEGHPFKIPGTATGLDLRRFGTITNEQVQKHTLRPDRITVPIVTEDDFVLHGGARFVGNTIVNVGGGLHADKASAGKDSLLKHLTDNDADSLWGHRHSSGVGEHALATADVPGFQSTTDFKKQRDLTMTILKWADIHDFVTAESAMGDAAATSLDNAKGIKYGVCRTGYITNVVAHIGQINGGVNLDVIIYTGTGVGATGVTVANFTQAAGPNGQNILAPTYTAQIPVTATPGAPALIFCTHKRQAGTLGTATQNLTVTAEYHYET